MASNIKLRTIVLDAICFLLVLVLYIVVIVLLYGTTDGLYPHKRAFHCDDTSIQRPIKKSIVSVQVSVAMWFIIPVTVIIIIEVINNKLKFGENQESKEEEEEETYGPFSLKPWIARLISLVVVFCFGALLVRNIKDVTKVTVGRLRPTFMATCKPNVSLADCQQGFITRDVCTGDPYDIKMARLSFPSGHASDSMYAMLFIAFYLQAAVRTDTTLLKPLLQGIAVSLSLFWGWRRVAENFHFFSDVLAGFAIGSIMAWFITFKILKLFAIRLRKPRVYTLLPNRSESSPSETLPTEETEDFRK